MKTIEGYYTLTLATDPPRVIIEVYPEPTDGGEKVRLILKEMS